MPISRLVSFTAAATVLGALVATSIPSASSAPPDPRPWFETGADSSEQASDTCCFRNPAYTGTCEVEPTEEETCASILEYLNNPMAEGKSYCGGTSVRQGWTQVACEEELPSNTN